MAKTVRKVMNLIPDTRDMYKLNNGKIDAPNKEVMPNKFAVGLYQENTCQRKIAKHLPQILRRFTMLQMKRKL
ncbi:MAG: hypothetical protein R3Y54_13465 [Eubacteriales bacterium]